MTFTVALIVSSCTTSNDGQPNAVFVTTTASPRTTAVPLGATTSVPSGTPVLAGLCPDPLVVQLDGPLDMWALPWTAMLATDGTAIDGSYRAQMVHPIDRSPMGIQLQLRQVTPVGRSVAEVLRDDRSVHLGVVSTDVSIAQRDAAPLNYLAAPWLHDDRIIWWDASAGGEALSIADLGPDPKITIAGTIDDPVIAYLVGTNLIVASQVTTEPAVLQFGQFLTDPLSWLSSNNTRRWQFLTDTGWSPYPHAVVASPSTATFLKPCLEVLVPMLQRAVVEVTREPERMVANLVEIATRSGNSISREATVTNLRAAIGNGLLNKIDNQTVAEVTQARMEQALRADATSRRVRGLSARSTDKLRQQARALITDYTANDLEIPVDETS